MAILNLSNTRLMLVFGGRRFAESLNHSTERPFLVSARGVNPYGTEGTRPPNVLVGGDANDNVPPIIR